MQQLLEVEMTEHIEVVPYERVGGRTGHRNGHKPRMLRTRGGTLNLLVPQDREGAFSTKLFSRYQRVTRRYWCWRSRRSVRGGFPTRKV